jgi:hypothetical protein
MGKIGRKSIDIAKRKKTGGGGGRFGPTPGVGNRTRVTLKH